MPYVWEAQELAQSLLRRLESLERLSGVQIAAAERADAEAEQAPDYRPEVLNTAQTLQVQAQDRFFDELEALLAGWSRLSLLFFPTAHSRRKHARALRKLLKVASDDQLADRKLRDSWMHFDERLASSISSKTFGNRHSFIRSHQLAGLKDETLRLMVMDTLEVYYRKRNGKVGRFDLKQLKSRLRSLGRAAEEAKARI